MLLRLDQTYIYGRFASLPGKRFHWPTDYVIVLLHNLVRRNSVLQQIKEKLIVNL